MPIFIDTSDIKEIERYHRMGILGGVTTNPSLMSKMGLSGMAGVKKCATDIAKLVEPLAVSVELFTTKKADMIAQAKEYASWAKNINVKVTITGPQGETEYVEIIHELETAHDIRVNVTAMMSAQQCFLAALAGATYVSIFGGRINNMGYNASDEIRKLRKVLDDFKLKSQIIVGSTREVLNIIEWFEAGAHIVTCTPQLIEGMLIHPFTKETVQQFLRDAASIVGNK